MWYGNLTWLANFLAVMQKIFAYAHYKIIGASCTAVAMGKQKSNQLVNSFT